MGGCRVVAASERGRIPGESYAPLMDFEVLRRYFEMNSGKVDGRSECIGLRLEKSSKLVDF